MSETTIYDDGRYLEQNPTWHAEDSPWKAKQILRILRKNGIAPTSVAEIGCGAGGILSCLADEYGEAVHFSGYDISHQAIEICKGKERPNLHFHLKDLLEEETAGFDVVMAIDVVEHIEDYFGFLRRLRSKGEYKIFHIPLDISLLMVWRNTPLVVGRREVGHIQYFTRDTALATLAETGYEVIDHAYTRAGIDRGHGWGSALLRLPRRLLFSLHQDLASRILGGFSLIVLAR